MSNLILNIKAIFNELVSRKQLDLSLPNKETAKAIEEARKGEGIVRCKDVDDMFDKLGHDSSEGL